MTRRRPMDAIQHESAVDMWILTLGEKRQTLRPGRHTIGGRAAGSVPFERLGALHPSAHITVKRDGRVSIRGLPDGSPTRVRGRMLGATAEPLGHGERIRIDGVELTLLRDAQCIEMPERTDGNELEPLPRDDDAATVVIAYLVEVGSSRAHAIRSGELTIGRDASCDVSLGGVSVSRRHARISARDDAITITDESSHGTRVNGARLTGPRVLHHGDRITLPGEELRLEIVGGSVLPPLEDRTGPLFVLSGPVTAPTRMRPTGAFESVRDAETPRVARAGWQWRVLGVLLRAIRDLRRGARRVR